MKNDLYSRGLVLYCFLIYRLCDIVQVGVCLKQISNQSVHPHSLIRVKKLPIECPLKTLIRLRGHMTS